MFLSDDGEDDDVAEGAAGELGPATHPRMHDDLLLGQVVQALVVVLAATEEPASHPPQHHSSLLLLLP